jgi:hypothetical protein
VQGSGEGLFNEYIDHFLKKKAEASGYPSNVKSDEDKDAYIARYMEKEKVRLDKDNIELNPGMRQLAKLCLNSFWGKFGQRNNLCQVEYITHPNHLMAILLDETKEISSFCFVSDEMVQLQWRYKTDFIEITSNTNPFIAAYTTAHARLKLYSYLEILQERVLYFDTDSVIYVTRPGEEKLPTGEFLGDLTNELESYGPGSSISEFCSAGPKNYTFTVQNPHGEIIGSCCKVKGISLNTLNSTLVNFETMKHMVTQNRQTEVRLSENRIARTKDHRIVTQSETKTWRVVYNKRQLQEDLTTLPWGHR